MHSNYITFEKLGSAKKSGSNDMRKNLKLYLQYTGINGTRFAALTTIAFFLYILSGCSETFQPWQENDQYHFSIFGYLDASADTQWVRVMPVREDLFLEPRPIDAVVTLEHVESGESVVMNDSLFSFFQGYAWNFWTTMELEPEQTYRITAERSDGQASQATVELPADFPTPLIQIQYTNNTPTSTRISIEGVNKLADVQTVFHPFFPSTGQGSQVRFSHLQDSVRIEPDGYVIQIDPLDDFRYLEMFHQVNPPVPLSEYLNPSSLYGPQQIFVASAGPEYHFFPSIDEKVIALPEGVSNVHNGIGYVAGVVSKTVPYESCFREGSTDLVPCELQPPPW